MDIKACMQFDRDRERRGLRRWRRRLHTEVVSNGKARACCVRVGFPISTQTVSN